tara:strand:+ start:1619 stop:2692 length:1074 start_codon:yes stop_codon:yes gene_type:complete
VSSQGFFNFGDNFDEQISGRFAGEKYNSDDQIASSLSSGGYGGYIDAGSRRGYVSPEQADKMLKNPETYKMRPSETRYLRESMGLPRASLSGGGVNVASADLEHKEKFDGYLNKFYGFDTDSRTWKNMGGAGKRILNDSFNDDSIKYKEGSLLNRAKPKEEKGNILQRIAGSIFDAVTGTQPAAADVLDGRINFNDSLPSTSTFSDTGDPSFRSYRMGQDFADSIQGIGNLPSDYKSTEAAAFRAAEKFRDTASGMSNLPSNYKATEAAAFRTASNFKEAQSIAKRNPNVSINSSGKAVATNNSATARAQASAVNRKLSGKSISQTKSENNKSMRDAARKRHAAFKKKRAQKKNKKN